MHHLLSVFYFEADSKTHFSDDSKKHSTTDQLVDAALDMELKKIGSRDMTFDQATEDTFNRSNLARFNIIFDVDYINAMGTHIIQGLRGVKHSDGRNVILLFEWDDKDIKSFKFNHKHPLVEQNS